MNARHKYFFIFFLFTFISTGVLHISNLYCLKKLSPLSLRQNVSIATSDDASYLAPPENWLKGNGWRSNAVGNTALTGRSPGYGMIYTSFRVSLSEQNALRVLLLLQFLLFAFAVTLLPKIGILIGLNFITAIFLSFFVATLPTFSGFLSYTLTEGFTPSLVIISLYLLLRYPYYTQVFYLHVAFSLGALILIRPPMLVWIFSVLILLLSTPLRQMRNRLGIIIVISLMPLMLWQIFISVQTKEVQSIHPIYQSNSNDLYRPLHKHIWDFHKSWGQTGADFNQNVNSLWGDAMNEKDPSQTIVQILENIDRDAVRLIGKAKLKKSYLDYFSILKNQVPYHKLKIVINGESIEEKELAQKFDAFQRKYTKQYPIDAYLLVPLKICFNLGFHSNLNLFVFQSAWRGNVFVEVMRYFSFFIHFGIFILFPIAAFTTRKFLFCRCISIPIIIYLAYLCFVQRGVEDRYTLPVLVPMLLIIAAGLDNFAKDLKTKFD